jgi:hypothetical protein
VFEVSLKLGALDLGFPRNVRSLTSVRGDVTLRSVFVNLSKAIMRPACINAGWPVMAWACVAKRPAMFRQDSRM